MLQHKEDGLSLWLSRSYLQCVRFLTDYINGDVYFKTKYAEHNYVRSRNQLLLYRDVRRHDQMMNEFIKKILKL